MGLFSKKYCEFCGEKLGLFGNTTLKDGYMCKNCARQISHWWSVGKSNTVAEMYEHIMYRNENKKKVRLINEQIKKAASIYHTWQSEGVNGFQYEVPELYRSVAIDEIEKKGWALTPSKYIEFIDNDLEIDYPTEITRIQNEIRELMAEEKQSQKMLEEAFRGIGYGIE